MKVFVLIKDVGAIDSVIVIFSTREKAKEYVAKLRYNKKELHIYGYTLDPEKK